MIQLKNDNNKIVDYHFKTSEITAQYSFVLYLKIIECILLNLITDSLSHTFSNQTHICYNITINLKF